jgi:hypothetical protein
MKGVGIDGTSSNLGAIPLPASSCRRVLGSQLNAGLTIRDVFASLAAPA